MFIPLLFMTGLVGRMFREFALTLTIAVVVSAIVSLTLTPMMCGRLLRAGHNDRASERNRGGLVRAFAATMDRVIDFYHDSLLWVLRHSFGTLMVTLLTLAATIALYVVMPKGFLPLQDTGLITATTEAGPAVSFAEMQRRQHLVENAIRKDPDVRGVVSVIGVSPLNATPNTGRMTITLKPRDERNDLVGAIMARLKRRRCRHPGRKGLFPGRAGHPDFNPRQPIAVSIHPRQHQPEGSGGMGGEADGGAAPVAGAARGRLRSAGERAARDGRRRPREGGPPRRLHAERDRHAQ